MRAGIGMPAAALSLARSDLRADEVSAAARGVAGVGHTTSHVHSPAPVRPPLVYMRRETGRRQSYLQSMQRLFGARRTGLWRLFTSRTPVLFLMIEDAFFLYVFAALVRALTGRRTVGLLARPMPLVASPRLLQRLKRRVLKALKHFDAIQTLTVYPFSALPDAATVAQGWIYDFQLWDLTAQERLAVEDLRSERDPGDRLVLMAIGAQNRPKGFELFASLYSRSAALRARFRFIACGRVARPLVPSAAALGHAGGVAVDRVVTDAELLGAYAASDAVWCFYPPVGDHASGILGRAVQLGIPVIVRYGSPAHRLCIVENLPHLAAGVEVLAERLCEALPARDERAGRLAAERFARHSEARLRTALGLV